MKVALTGATGRLGRALQAALGETHQVVTPGQGDDLRDPEVAGRLVAGADALVHLSPIEDVPGEAAGTWLDRATRGTYVLLLAAVAAGVKRVVVGSTLDLFERYPAGWEVTEDWQPLPDVTEPRQLAAYLAEESAKQLARVEPLAVVCLRFGTVVDDADVAGRAYDPRWLHVADAVTACRLAVDAPLPVRGDHATRGPDGGWWVYHIPGGGRYTRLPLAAAKSPKGLGYRPQEGFTGAPGAAAGLPAPDDVASGPIRLEPRRQIASRPIRNVVVFGAGGPLAAATAKALAPSYRLRLTDVRPLAEIAAEGKPQSPGAPLPAVLGPPHETMQVDVADPEAVQRACAGMDAVINCTVVRPHPVQAFRVNCLGAYNVMRAAVANGIRRVVQTGPLQVLNDRTAGYWWDFDVPDDAPSRPGSWLYAHSKYLGQETVRLFAEQYDLQVPVLLFCKFVDATRPPRESAHPMTVSWDDAADALRRAVEVPDLPAPYEPLHILADLPHGKYSGAKAYRILGWRPRDDLAAHYARRQPADD